MQNGIMLPSVEDKKKYREQRVMSYISSAKNGATLYGFVQMVSTKMLRRSCNC